MAAQTRVGALLIWIGVMFALITIFGLLAHFHIFHFKNVLPSSCSFGQSIECDSYLLHRGSIQLKLINKLKETIVVTGFLAARDGAQIPCEDFEQRQWISGEPLNISLKCAFYDSEMVPGFKEKLNVDIEYYPPQSGPKFSKKISGTVFTFYRNETF